MSRGAGAESKVRGGQEGKRERHEMKMGARG